MLEKIGQNEMLSITSLAGAFRRRRGTNRDIVGQDNDGEGNAVARGTLKFFFVTRVPSSCFGNISIVRPSMDSGQKLGNISFLKASLSAV